MSYFKRIGRKNRRSLYEYCGKPKGERGIRHLKKAGRPDSHVIEILTEKTPSKYRAYLRKQGVSYIIAGRDSLDCQLAAKKLKELFGIDKMLICGGGMVNWSFISQGVVDELSLLLSPVADGDPGTPALPA